ncbi:hypothetical protein [Orenia marismortui]|uniref:Cobalamin-dependent methionine synthase-like protein n=1 Tax=Orenia marismortui TaxID=46469 RepID=A0A4R8H8Y5_9FIRM|nr:hypothetical protein C7959_10785 [Orenia marismortui]
MDAIASIAAEEVANEINQIIVQRSKELNLPHQTMRYSPGYGDLEIDIQPKLLAVLDGEKLGISATKTCILQPEKSITAIIGLGTNENSYKAKCDFHCASCKFDTCVYDKLATSH